jgi:GNAT superfamily N-acetyltransferase
VEIRPTTEEDWAPLRDIRLRALADSPSAFGSTFEGERDRTEAEWRQWAGRGRSGRGVMFVAAVDGRFVGIAGGFPEEERPDAVHLVSMWVEPESRRDGVGRALIDAVVRWAGDAGASVVNLWVTDGNDQAIALYRACGFVATGEQQPLPSNPALNEEKYRLTLPAGTAPSS